jgi:1-deoxy-D-xylulose-5-phosphate reductoisomerase
LGSTGSIGLSTLKVIEANPERYVVCALAADSSCHTLAGQALRHRQALLYLSGPHAENTLARLLPAAAGRIIKGEKALPLLIKDSAPDIVVNAVSGSAGLAFTLASLEAGIPLALANKESLVMAGELVLRLAKNKNTEIIPLDSEHSALAQIWPGSGQVKNIWITGSGGPFLNFRKQDMESVTPAMALNHPTWRMGPKISVDSATMMNKGLEVIEAAHLFALDYERIRVVIHPQSLVHGLIEMDDGSWMAQMGPAEMRQPIAWALSRPERLPAAWPLLNLWDMGNLSFSQPDYERFPALALALKAGKEGGSAPCLLNAANEVAVAAFLAGRLPFTAIAVCVEAVLNEIPADSDACLESVMAAHHKARHAAQRWIAKNG